MLKKGGGTWERGYIGYIFQIVLFIIGLSAVEKVTFLVTLWLQVTVTEGYILFFRGIFLSY